MCQVSNFSGITFGDHCLVSVSGITFKRYHFQVSLLGYQFQASLSGFISSRYNFWVSVSCITLGITFCISVSCITFGYHFFQGVIFRNHFLGNSFRYHFWASKDIIPTAPPFRVIFTENKGSQLAILMDRP